MLERVLVPLDGSPLAEAILTQVRRLLFYKDADVLLLRVVSVPSGLNAEAVDLPEVLRAQAAAYLDEIARKLGAQGARVRTLVRRGRAADVILDVAAEERASLVAMSTHGRTGIARWVLGSVAEKVIRASPVPVLAVRSFPAPGPDELHLKRILVPLADEPPSMEVVGPALELARLFEARVTLLHACDGVECTVPVPDLTRVYERFRAGGVDVEPMMKQGDPAKEILEACHDIGADLIAMTTHGRSGLSRWTLGSVTEKVLRASDVPLLIVRPPQD